MMSCFAFWAAHRGELAAARAAHRSGAGLHDWPRPRWVFRRASWRRGGRVPVGDPAVANVTQTMPSLALLGFLLPLPFIGGIGPRTALVALSIYALLPIVRTTVTGISRHRSARSSRRASRWA